MRNRTLALVASLLGAVLALPLAAGPVGAGPPPGLSISTEDLDILDVPTFSFEVLGDVCLSDTVVTVPGAPDVQVDLTDANSGTVELPGAPAGEYEIVVTCTTDVGTQEGSGFIDFGYVVVEKVVTGDVPAGTQFVIAVECSGPLFLSGSEYGAGGGAEADGDPFVEADLTFGETGGTQSLVHYRLQECTITETDTGGALTVSVDTEDCGSATPVSPAEATSGDFFVGAAESCTQTVTNEFAPADVGPDDLEPDVGPVAAAPTFTG